jgi:YD repeat-containing protein
MERPKRAWLALVAAVAMEGSARPAAADTVTYTYDVQGRVATASYSDGTLICYQYDAAGNRTAYSVAAASSCPMTDGTVLYSSTTSGSYSFTVPSNALGYVTVTIWGAGGGSTKFAQAYGGGSAVYHYTVTPGTTVVSGSVGAGGASNGGAGGTTSVSSPTMSATGGSMSAGGFGSGGQTNYTATGGNGANGGGAVGSTTGAMGNAPGGAGAIGQPGGEGEQAIPGGAGGNGGVSVVAHSN